MKKDQPVSKENTGKSTKSFSAAFGQMAQLLRSEVKMKERATKVISPHSLPASF